jgi:hypothetical protein
MAVNVFMKTCRGEFTGTFAEIDGRSIALYLEGGEKLVFPANQVNITADHPDEELRVRPRQPRLQRLRQVLRWVAGETDAGKHEDKNLIGRQS